MFIISKKNFLISRKGQEPYPIKKDFVGEIPEEIADHWLIRAAVLDGSIATPQGKKDKDLEAADVKAGEKAAEADIRPDAKPDQNPKQKEKGEKDRK